MDPAVAPQSAESWSDGRDGRMTPLRSQQACGWIGSRRRPRRLRLLALLLVPLLLTGCLRRISGTYKDASGQVSLEFHRDGKVYAKVFGVPMVGDFEEKDNKILFKGPRGDLFIDIVDANTLSMSHPLSAFTGELRLIRQK